MRLVDPSTSDGKAFLEFGGKIQMTPDTAAADWASSAHVGEGGTGLFGMH